MLKLLAALRKCVSEICLVEKGISFNSVIFEISVHKIIHMIHYPFSPTPPAISIINYTGNTVCSHYLNFHSNKLNFKALFSFNLGFKSVTNNSIKLATLIGKIQTKILLK